VGVLIGGEGAPPHRNEVRKFVFLFFKAINKQVRLFGGLLLQLNRTGIAQLAVVMPYSPTSSI
jgi:hypothetical protein